MYSLIITIYILWTWEFILPYPRGKIDVLTFRGGKRKRKIKTNHHSARHSP